MRAERVLTGAQPAAVGTVLLAEIAAATTERELWSAAAAALDLKHAGVLTLLEGILVLDAVEEQADALGIPLGAGASTSGTEGREAR